MNQDSSTFSEAKDRLIKKQLLLPRDWILQTPAHFELKYTLEYVCCQLARYYLAEDANLTNVVALNSSFQEILKAMKTIQKELKKTPNMPFGNSVIQQVFKLTLHELINSDTRNIYTSGKNHFFIAREIITKRAIGMLNPYWSRSKVSNNFITDIALAITDRFFETRMANHPAKLALKIKADSEENASLMNMTVENLLIHLNNKKI